MASKAKGKKDAKAKTPVIPENWDHRVLVTGAAGQIGSELVVELRKRYGGKNIIAAVHKKPPTDEVKNGGPVEVVDVTDKKRLEEVIKQHKVDIIYHLASVLSGAGEVDPPLCWQTNLTSLQNVLDLARDLSTKENPLRVFWSSSIAAFGPSAPKEKAPQKAVLDPRTFYGVTKVSGELLCNYYYHRWGVDVRTIRYVGVLTTKSEAGVNVSDFAIDMPHHAVNKKPYNCYLTPTTRLPWIYMPDALDATIALMEAPIEKIKIRVGYNVQGCSFTPAELVSAIQKHEKDFKVKYTKQENDNRQGIADSVPSSLDDRNFRDDVGWSHKFGLNELVADMIKYLKEHPSEIKEKKVEDAPEQTKKGSKDKAKSTQKEEAPQKKADKSKPKKKEESDNEEEDEDEEEEPKPKGGKKQEAEKPSKQEKSKPKTKEPSDNEEEDVDDESQKKGEQELTPLQLEVKAERERKAKEEAALIAEKERLAKEQADKVKKEQALREKQKQEEREKRRRDKEEKDERRLEKKKEREKREAEDEEEEEEEEEEEKGSKKKGGRKDEDVWEGAGRSGRDDRGARGKDKDRDRERVANAKAAKARKQRAGLPQEEEAARKKAARQGGARGARGAGGRGRDDDDEEDDEEEEEEETPKPKGKAGGGVKAAKKKEEDDEDDEDEAKQAPKKVTLPPVPAIKMKGLIQVLPYLYLGGEAAAGARDELKAQGITHIINCVSEEVENQFPKEFKYTSFPLADEHDANPSQYFDEAYDVISKVKNSNSQRVLVHCTTGNCVGATIVLAYMLMSSKNQEKHLPLAKALEFLTGKEPAIKPSDDFLGELVNLEKDLYDTVSIKLKRPGGGRGGRGGGGRSHPRGKGRRGK